MTPDNIEALVERLGELAGDLASDEQSRRYYARLELAGKLPEIRNALTSYMEEVARLRTLLALSQVYVGEAAKKGGEMAEELFFDIKEALSHSSLGGGAR